MAKTNQRTLIYAFREKIVIKKHDFGLPDGGIILEHGFYNRRNDKGFGREKIWKKHRREMKNRNRNFDSIDHVVEFLQDIICPRAEVYYENLQNKGERISVIRYWRNARSGGGGIWGIAILQFDHRKSVYRVITAYARKNKHGSKVGTVL